MKFVFPYQGQCAARPDSRTLSSPPARGSPPSVFHWYTIIGNPEDGQLLQAQICDDPEKCWGVHYADNDWEQLLRREIGHFYKKPAQDGSARKTLRGDTSGVVVDVWGFWRDMGGFFYFSLAMGDVVCYPPSNLGSLQVVVLDCVVLNTLRSHVSS